MAKLAKLKFDEEMCCYTCRHKLGTAKVDVHIDISEETVDVDRLTGVAQKVIDDWAARHKRLAKLVGDELASNEYIAKASKIGAAQCVPFYLGVYADSEGEISYTVGFNVPSVLDDEDKYVEVEEEINAEWVNTDICSTE